VSPAGKPVIPMVKVLFLWSVLALLLAGGACLRPASGQTADTTRTQPLLAELQATPRFDFSQAHQLIRSTFEKDVRSQFEVAAAAYLDILRNLPELSASSAASELWYHLEPLVLILPSDIRESAGLPGRVTPSTTLFPSERAGEVLIIWWRSQDVIPATARNERLEEFLSLVGRARTSYPRSDGTLDARGQVFVRFGEPSRSTVVRLEQEHRRAVSQTGRQLIDVPGDHPPNEFWVYAQVGHNIHYLFVRDGDGYRIGDSADLFPRRLLSGRNAVGGILIMENIYRQLALYHIDYSDVYGRLSEYMVDYSSMRIGAPMVTVPMMPPAFINSAFSNAQARDFQIARERSAAEPLSHSNILEDLGELDIEVRTARFLDADGTTRTEVYWGGVESTFYPGSRIRQRLRSEGFDSVPEEYLIAGTLVRHAPDYTRRGSIRHRNLIRVSRDGQGLTMPPRYIARGDTGVYHIAVQWDQFAIHPEAHNLDFRLGPLVHTGVHRLDTLVALRSDRLEMSDLKPVRMTMDPVLADEAWAAEAGGYPYRRTIHGMPLAIYFEIYNLAADGGDDVRYSIEYEVTRPVGFTVLGDPRSGDRTTARTTYSTTESIVRQLIVPDMDGWEQGGKLGITVRVRDEDTGESVERHIEFEVVDSRAIPAALPP
jgi:hypothetical protein